MSFGDYKQLTERVISGWKRGDHAGVVGDAERAYVLETGELAPHGYGHAAWGLISVYTGLRRFDDARRIFAEVIDDKELLAARVKRDAATVEKIVIAGACIAWESGDFKAQAKTMRRAYDRRAPDTADLTYAFACFFARIGDSRAWKALHEALANGTVLASVLLDDDLASLHTDRRWDDIVARDRPWQIDSRPPGARIFLDDVDTGVVTPGRVKPTAKRHRVKLVLAGYADEEHEVTGANYSLGCGLTSLADIGERQRMAEDAAREPDEAQRAKTRALVGDVRRARITLTRHTTYGLGGLTIEVGGDGRVVLDRGTFMPTDKPMHHEVRADTAALFEQFIVAAFTELVIANQPGVPDELYLDLVLAGEGGTCKRGKFASKPHARFDALVQAVRELALRAVAPSLHEVLSLA
ncbi:MAG TPA: PEGA domain-containing protein [Kofleriaceae bacterium]|nr:PEGA domain-containing protein [Kofleriaceae bacterium]